MFSGYWRFDNLTLEFDPKSCQCELCRLLWGFQTTSESPHPSSSMSSCTHNPWRRSMKFSSNRDGACCGRNAMGSRSLWEKIEKMRMWSTLRWQKLPARAPVAMRKKVGSIGHFSPCFCLQSLQIVLLVKSNQEQFYVLIALKIREKHYSTR